LVSAVTDLHAHALDLCRALIRCPSVTPREAGAFDVLEAPLRAAGFAVERVSFSAEGLPDVANLYARFGTSGPCLAFAGHTDVVPPGDPAAWRFDPFAGAVADGQIWGRGTADMKGGVAAFVAAACAFAAKAPPRGSVALLITGDEEGPAVNGTVKLLDWAAARGARFDHCIVGEPTNPEALGDMIKIGRRGSLNGTLTVEGRQGHSAYPQRADNPIPHLLRLLGALIATPLDDGTADFDPTNLQIVTVDVGNAAFNVIPARATARFNVRFNDLWTWQTLQAEIERRCAGVAADARYALRFEPCNAPAFLTSKGAFTDLVAKAIQKRTGRAPVLSTTGGTSDARFIRAYCPVVEFGLAGQTMHMVDEHVPVADLHGLADIYADILDAYFADPPSS
jgi:succinyl-diaminopimelate desuccinylase